MMQFILNCSAGLVGGLVVFYLIDWLKYGRRPWE